MSKRYTYATSLSFGTDGEPGYSEAEVEVSYLVSWGRPAQTYGPPENCYPADPDEIDDVRLEKVEGKARPWDMGWGYISDDAFAEMVWLSLDCTRHHAAMLEQATEEEWARDDDASERSYEARLEMLREPDGTGEPW